MSTLELLRAAEDRIDVLIAENDSLHHRVSVAQAAEYNLNNRYRSLINEHNDCRGVKDQLRAKVSEVVRLKQKLGDEQDRVERLRAEIHRLGGAGNYRQRYEDKLVELVELKRRLAQSDDLLLQRDRKITELRNHAALQSDRISRKDKTIATMKRLLSQLGYTYMERE